MFPDLHHDVRDDELPDPAWAERFTRAAGEDAADAFDPREDVARGRAHLVRRRVLLGTGSVLAGTVVVGTALLATSGSQVRGTVPEPATSTTSSPARTFQEPVVTLEPSPSPRKRSGSAQILPGAGIPGRAASAPWRNRLFDVTASVIDPGGSFLNYDTDSLQAGVDAQGDRSMGITMGWTQPGQSGEAEVQVAVSEQSGPEADESSLYLGAPLAPRTLANGETVQVGSREDGAFAVSYRQPDGELVWALVDPLFGNNSEVAVRGLTLTERDVIRLVQDERLNLPPR